MRDAAWKTAMMVRRAAGSVRRRGLWATVRLAAEAAGRLIWLRRHVLRFHIVNERAHRLTRPLEGIEWQEATEADLEELLTCSRHFGPAEFRARRRAGHRCLIARAEDSRIVFYGWIGRGRAHVPVLGRTVAIPPDTAYYYNTFTEEAFRDRRLLPAFISLAHEFTRREGIPYGFTLVDTEAGLPVRAYMRLVGAESIRLITYRRLLGWRSWSERPIEPEQAGRLTRRKYR